MKIIHFLSALILLAIHIALHGQTQAWIQTNGPNIGNIKRLVNGPFNSLYAASVGGAYRSPDFGLTWKCIGFPGEYVHSIYATRNNLLFISTISTIYRSDDTGRSWKDISSTLTGRVWSWFEDANGTMYAGSSGNGVYSSTDLGNTWSPRSTGLPAGAYVHRFLERNGYLFCVIANYGIYRSSNHGQNWEPCNNGLADLAIWSIAALDTGSIYAASQSGLYCSADNGNQWTLTNFTKPSDYVLIMPNNILFVSTVYGLYRSTDNGIIWDKITAGLGLPSYFEMAAIPPIFVIVSSYNALHRSTDGGLTFSDVGLPVNNIYSLFQLNNSAIFAGGENGLHSTTNYGAVWKNTIKNNPSAIISMGINTSGYMFFGTASEGVYQSSDTGNTWIWSFRQEQKINSIATDGNNFVYASTDTSGVIRSSDNGQTWESLHSPQPKVSFVCQSTVSNTLYAASKFHGVYSSTNRGVDWHDITGIVSNDISCLYVDNSGNVIAGTESGKVYRLPFGSQSWSQVGNLGVPITSITARGGRTIYIGTQTGISVYDADFPSWSTFNEGLDRPKVNCLLFARWDRYMYAGVQLGSVYRTAYQFFGIKNVPSQSESFNLAQNYPNPFNPATTISFALSRPAYLDLIVYDITGAEYAAIFKHKYYIEGNYSVEFNTHDIQGITPLSGGIYFYRLSDGSRQITRKMIYLP